MAEAGLIKATFLESDQAGVEAVIVHRLTWDGHEFLDAARNDTIWQEAKELFLKKALGLSVESFKMVLLGLIKDQLGL